MLAHFSLLGAFFCALGWFVNASCTSLAHVGRFFRAWGRSGLDFGRSGQGFGAFKTTFVDDLCRWQARITEMLFIQQNHNFGDVFKFQNMPQTATEHVFCIAFKAFLDMVQ